MRTAATVTSALFLLTGLAFTADTAAESGTASRKAVCVLHPVGKSSQVTGTLTFTQKDDSVEVSGEVSGLTPGEHGFHVHEYGDCACADGKCAGGHFNPTKMPHGGPESERRHVGDLGNIKAGEDGKAMVKIEDKMIQLHGEHSIVGLSIIVHAKADDEKSQPAGNAGDRVACGVIGLAKP